jgi:ABC-type hemin transport system ATPase subunit
MTELIDRILEWAGALPYWEKAALQKILSGRAITGEDVEVLLGHLLFDAGLAEKVGVRDEITFPKRAPAGGRSTSAVRLVRVFELRNVNAIVPGQELPFSPGLTTIFGANGAGKSGYARVLASAGFTRGDRQVLPDVSLANNVDLAAAIELIIDGETRTVHYKVGEPLQELSSLYVFDSTSVRIHLTGKNRFSFSPAGLNLLTQLARVTDMVRGRLREEIDKRGADRFFQELFHGESPIREIAASLGSVTDPGAVRQLGILSDEEGQRIDALEREIAQIRARDAATSINRLDREIDDLKALVEDIERVQMLLSPTKLQELKRRVLDKRTATLNAQRIGSERFKAEGLQHVGGEEWYRFIDAAKVLAILEESEGEAYPRADSRCLLCQQPLSQKARKLILRLWAYLEEDAKSNLEAARQAVSDGLRGLEELNLDSLGPDSVGYRHTLVRSEHVASAISEFKGLASAVREAWLVLPRAMQLEDAPIQALEGGPANDLQELVEAAMSERIELASMRAEDMLEGLDRELLFLRHREILGEHLDQILTYIEDRKWAEQAARVGGSTAHITLMYNELFEELVTNRYLELFKGILERMARNLDVNVAVSGKKGETIKQIVLSKIAPEMRDMADPESVLSEGEKRVVALADFLTEVALDSDCSAIVLDDPVTSLDLGWRETIAQLIVHEARERQVVVFTHDLPFLYYLARYAEGAQVDTRSHWIVRGDDGRPGYVHQDNSPALEKDYRSSKIPHECYLRAKQADSEEERELHLRNGFAALRTCYEAFIVFEMFNAVVMRFEERIAFSRLSGVVWDSQIAQTATIKFEWLSRLIEGHLHSDALAIRPKLDDLIREIEEFDDTRKQLKELAKNP